MRNNALFKITSSFNDSMLVQRRINFEALSLSNLVLALPLVHRMKNKIAYIFMPFG